MKVFFYKILIISLFLNLFTEDARTQNTESSSLVIIYLDSLDEETKSLISKDILDLFYKNPDKYTASFVKNFIDDYMKKESGKEVVEEVEKVAPSDEIAEEIEEVEPSGKESQPSDKERIQELLDELSEIERQVIPSDEQKALLHYYTFEEAGVEIDYWRNIASKRMADKKTITDYLATLDQEILNRLHDETIYDGKAKEIMDNLVDYSKDAPHLDFLQRIVRYVERLIKTEKINARDEYLDSLDSEKLNLIDPTWIKKWRVPNSEYELKDIKSFVQKIMDAPRPPKPIVLAYAFSNEDEQEKRVLPVIGFKFKNIDKYAADPTGKEIQYECQIRMEDEWFTAIHYPGHIPPGIWNLYYGALDSFEIRFRIVDWILVNGNSGKISGEWSDSIKITKAFYSFHMRELIENEANPDFYGFLPINSSIKLNWNALFTRIGDTYDLWDDINKAGWNWETGVTKAIILKLPSLAGQTPREFIDGMDEYPDIVFALEVIFELEITAPKEFTDLFDLD